MNAADDAGPVTIVTAVRNAEEQIGSAIRCLAELDYDGPVELIVVDNNSTDRTADRAREMKSVVETRGWKLRLMEVNEPGKPKALREAAKAAAPGYFVICDVRVRPHAPALSEMLRAIREEGMLLVSGDLQYMPSPSPVVSAFSRAYACAPYARGEDVQGTFLAFAPEHRHVVEEMPDVGADDRYFLLATPRDRRRRVHAAPVDYPFPDRFAGLLRQQLRWRQTNRAVDQAFPEGERPLHEANRRPYFQPRPSWIDILVYAAIILGTELAARIFPSRRPSW